MGLQSSPHRKCAMLYENLNKLAQHIDKVLNAQSREDVLKNRMRLKAIIETVRFLALQGISFRGHDESSSSLNRGNFIEVLKYKAEGNDEISSVILDNAPQNAQYIAPSIQKEILHILTNRVRKIICDEVAGGKYCILVDEAQDESKTEQMALVLRYVKHDGVLMELFFDIVGVKNILAVTLKDAISGILAQFDLLIQNLRGQGYDGASNMRGEWNGLQALFVKDCPFAYYVHCFAHLLQVALVAAAKDKPKIWQFFSHLTCIVNLVTSSPKRIGELKSFQRDEIARMLSTGERQSGKGANEIGTLHRAEATRWSSHYDSVRNLIDMYTTSCTVVESLRKGGQNQQIRGQALGVYNAMRSFEFIFILHLMDSIMGFTDALCQALQHKSQDILNALKLVSTTKTLLQNFRQDDWDIFLANVVSFYNRHNIDIPDLTSRYVEGTGRHCQQQDNITVEHHYHFDIFNSVIDLQLMELNHRFNNEVVELLTFSSALDPSDSFKSFNMENICNLAEKFYHWDFTHQDLKVLKIQLMHYQLDVPSDHEFQNTSSLTDLCRKLVVRRKSKCYPLVDGLIRLVLTLPVSTTTTERAFSGMKRVKTAQRSTMGDEFLADCMTVNFEQDLVWKINLESIINEFESLKTRRAQLK
ncbi:uncharacterized protein LOC132277645 [Cornus florida]|uniref:uncharacterized protein LOC132277645 n=1 Tax=Cornus florida TaxID=4283 RepID=UPI00289C24C1|nr:uncharacterized protein LOC132277645 [Cornus florida]